METTTTLQPAQAENQPAKAPVRIGERGLALGSLEDLWRFSGYVARSGLAPKGIQTPEAIFVAVQMGLEVGLTPMAALQNIAVINGRPSLWGDAQLGVVRSTGELEIFEEWFEQAGRKLPRVPATYTDDVTAVCRIKRRGYPVTESSFSVMEAKTSNLWKKEGPWSQYPARMLKFRARSFGLRDQFGDALKGLRTAEEVIDAPFIDVSPAPQFETPKEAQEQPPKAAEMEPAPTQAELYKAEAIKAEAMALTQTPQEQLAEYVVTTCGGTFDQFQAVVTKQGWAKGAELWTSFEDVPPETVRRILNAKRGLLSALAKEAHA